MRMNERRRRRKREPVGMFAIFGKLNLNLSSLGARPKAPTKTKVSLYGKLGLTNTATQEDIHRAYKLLLERYTKEKTENKKRANKKIKQVQRAFDILSDEKTRALYDEHGSVGRWLKIKQKFSPENIDKQSSVVKGFWSCFFSATCCCFCYCCGCCCGRLNSNNNGDYDDDDEIYMRQTYPEYLVDQSSGTPLPGFLGRRQRRKLQREAARKRRRDYYHYQHEAKKHREEQKLKRNKTDQNQMKPDSNREELNTSQIELDQTDLDLEQTKIDSYKSRLKSSQTESTVPHHQTCEACLDDSGRSEAGQNDLKRPQYLHDLNAHLNSRMTHDSQTRIQTLAEERKETRMLSADASIVIAEENHDTDSATGTLGDDVTVPNEEQVKWRHRMRKFKRDDSGYIGSNNDSGGEEEEDEDDDDDDDEDDDDSSADLDHQHRNHNACKNAKNSRRYCRDCNAVDDLDIQKSSESTVATANSESSLPNDSENLHQSPAHRKICMAHIHATSLEYEDSHTQYSTSVTGAGAKSMDEPKRKDTSQSQVLSGNTTGGGGGGGVDSDDEYDIIDYSDAAAVTVANDNDDETFIPFSILSRILPVWGKSESHSGKKKPVRKDSGLSLGEINKGFVEDK